MLGRPLRTAGPSPACPDPFKYPAHAAAIQAEPCPNFSGCEGFFDVQTNDLLAADHLLLSRRARTAAASRGSTTASLDEYLAHAFVTQAKACPNFSEGEALLHT